MRFLNIIISWLSIFGGLFYFIFTFYFLILQNIIKPYAFYQIYMNWIDYLLACISSFFLALAGMFYFLKKSNYFIFYKVGFIGFILNSIAGYYLRNGGQIGFLLNYIVIIGAILGLIYFSLPFHKNPPR